MADSSRLQHLPARNSGTWMSGAIVCAVLFIAVYLMFVLSVPGQLIDVALRETTFAFDHPLPNLDPQNRWIAVWILAPPVLALLALTLPGRRLITLGITAGFIAAANVTTQIVKHVWLQRPELIAEAGTDNALPSGHTTMAASAAVAVFLAAPARYRPAAGAAGAVWGGGWGALIFLESWHWPSDMVSAYLVVAGWGLVAGWLVMRLSPEANTLHREIPGAVVYEVLCWAAGVLLTAAAVGCLYAGGGWAGLERTLDGDPSRWHWLSGTLLSVGPAFLAAAVGIRFFHREAGRQPSAARRRRVSGAQG